MTDVNGAGSADAVHAATTGQMTVKSVWRTGELLAAGKTHRQISAAVEEGVLFRIVQGLYTTTEPTDLLRLQALAVAHPGLVYTGPTAAWLYDIGSLRWPATGRVPRTVSRKGGDLLELRHGAPGRTRTVHRLAVTSPVETAADLLADGWTPRQLRGFLVERYTGTRGNDILDADLAALTRGRRDAATALDGLVTGTASGLERRVAERIGPRIRKLGATLLVNRKMRHYRFDFTVPEAGLLIEIDSYAYHGKDGSLADDDQFALDRWKGNAATRWGWGLLRYADLCFELMPGKVADEIVDTVRARMAAGRWRFRGLPEEELETDGAVWGWHGSFR